jgi:hypothetical protein
VVGVGAECGMASLEVEERAWGREVREADGDAAKGGLPRWRLE